MQNTSFDLIHFHLVSSALCREAQSLSGGATAAPSGGELSISINSSSKSFAAALTDSFELSSKMLSKAQIIAVLGGVDRMGLGMVMGWYPYGLRYRAPIDFWLVRIALVHACKVKKLAPAQKKWKRYICQIRRFLLGYISVVLALKGWN